MINTVAICVDEIIDAAPITNVVDLVAKDQIVFDALGNANVDDVT